MLERFDRYMERCLYDPDQGFYASGAGSAGRRGGDFLTSPEVGPLFADVLAKALDGWWVTLGRPDPFVVYDAGSGPGTLAQALDRAGGACASARRVVGFDRASTLAQGSDPMPARLDGAVVIANELLDNLPFRVLERAEAGWSEVFVASEHGAPPTEVRQPLDQPVEGGAEAIERLPVGARIPVHERAKSWIEGAFGRGAAMVVAFDYGARTTAELAARGGWLRTYRRHHRGHDPYIEPGRWDITTDVAFDQLPPPATLIDQAAALRGWGIEALVAEGRQHWEANAASPDLEAFRMRSRIGEAEALLDPEGLGSWLVATWLAG